VLPNEPVITDTVLVFSLTARSRLAVPYWKIVLKDSLTLPASMPLRTGPKRSHFPFVKRCICICSIGA
jgi:hypothetical protein